MANDNPILHLVVVGFHHKKGYQVDYSYPPLDKVHDANECPAGWKYLPTLALPDGSHNFSEDTVFFNLPSLTDPDSTVFGISCYRQIRAEKLKVITADVTRSTVQKAVCAISTIPLYGYIEVKLSLIAQAFFDQGDFSNISIIQKAYDNLNTCLIENISSLTPIKQTFIGLSVRDIILKWRHKILILFKLILLQRKVVCFGSPVRPICSLILGILSLHPEMLDNGLEHSASVRTSRPMSPMPDFSEEGTEVNTDELTVPSAIPFDRKISVSEVEHLAILSTVDPEVKDTNGKQLSDKNNISRDTSVDTLASKNSSPENAVPVAGENVLLFAGSLLPYCAIGAKSYGAPLPLFTNGTLCLPYLSLPYMDLLTDSSVNGFIIGTSNILFRQKRQIMDVLIDVEHATIETQDQDLRRQLSLTTEDLRFVDFVVKTVQFPKEDGEGSEQWIRQQFQGYMLAILRAAVLTMDGTKEMEHFNFHFLNAWKRTNGYQNWLSTTKANNFDFEQLPTGHPFAGTISMGDVKLKLAHTMNSSESGRKVNQAVRSTGIAVGGALFQAKASFSNFWSTFAAPIATTAPPTPTAGQPSTESLNKRTTEINESEHNPKDGNAEEEDVITVKINIKENEIQNTTLIEENITETNNSGIVEIGREPEIFNSKNNKIGSIQDV